MFVGHHQCRAAATEGDSPTRAPPADQVPNVRQLTRGDHNLVTAVSEANGNNLGGGRCGHSAGSRGRRKRTNANDTERRKQQSGGPCRLADPGEPVRHNLRGTAQPLHTASGGVVERPMWQRGASQRRAGMEAPGEGRPEQGDSRVAILPLGQPHWQKRHECHWSLRGPCGGPCGGPSTVGTATARAGFARRVEGLRPAAGARLRRRHR